MSSQTQTAFRFTTRTNVSNIQEFKEPIPTPGPYEILVKVRSVALNQRDVHVALDTYPLPVKEGVIPGSEYVFVSFYPLTFLPNPQE